MSHILWHTLSKEKLWQELKTSPKGLELAEAARRLKLHGSNKSAVRKRRSLPALFVDQVANPLILILVVAAVLTAVFHEVHDTLAISVAILLNMVVGFVQEYRAERSLAKLRELLAPTARVRRENQEREILAEKLVPGDVILLYPGDRVPADARLVESYELEVNESILTGESVPVLKEERALKDGWGLAERHNMVYAGTVAVAGEGEAIITATGAGTELSKIARELQEIPREPTPLQKKLKVLSRQISALVLLVAIFVLVVGLALGRSFVEIFTVAIALAVAAIPEGLVVAVTAILAVGMQRILARKALVRKLVAAETLGSTTVICTDKTGTLTVGEMQAVRVVTAAGSLEVGGEFLPDGQAKEVLMLLRAMVLGTSAIIEDPEAPPEQWKILGSYTERALLELAGKARLHPEHLRQTSPLLDDLPFTSAQKFQATLRREGGRHGLFWVGAPERIITFCTLTSVENAFWHRHIKTLAEDGYRVVGVARRDIHTEKRTFIDLGELARSGGTFLGLIALRDPIRAGLREVLAKTKAAGITTVMVTGDHPATAFKVGQELDLVSSPTQVLSGEALSLISEAELAARVRQIRIYARVSPHDKVKIVGAWQAQGEIVAMTGDGVNDAPALAKANIGIAMGTGADLAKETADLVLLDNNFSTIVAAVEEGRVMYDNIRKVVLYLMADSFAGVVLVLGALLLDLPLPILAAQLLWLNILGDGIPTIALTFDPPEGQVLSREPVRLADRILDRPRLWFVCLISGVIGLVSLLVFTFTYRLTQDLILARTLVFATFGSASLWYIFGCRTFLRQGVLSQYLWSNVGLWLAVGVSFSLLLVAIYLPAVQEVLGTVGLSPAAWFMVLAISLFIVILLEVVKKYLVKLQKTPTLG